jgi:hypothetical protein
MAVEINGLGFDSRAPSPVVGGQLLPFPTATASPLSAGFFLGWGWAPGNKVY